MHLSQLQIFSQKRDASATLKGYEFQHLKTLKTWLENRLGKVDEWIYCDYEEDIFQRDIAKGKIRFRQIKLYSTDFSFSSAAIQETVDHFFMLFVKGDYMFDTITFSFETNAPVVEHERRGNDAELLRELSGGWTAMPEERKIRARGRFREILQEYIDRRSQALSHDGGLQDDVKRAWEVFDGLTVEVLDHFSVSIRWKFDGITTNEAVDALRNEITELIGQLPLPAVGTPGVIFSVLYKVVTDRAMKDDPEERKLMIRDMDLALLHSGDEKARWYAEVYEKWSPVTGITGFFSGQFYEMVDASRYSRMNMYDGGHGRDWQWLLDIYISDSEVPLKHRRKATYEYLFLALNPDPLSAKERGSFRGLEERVRFYYNNADASASAEEIQEDRVLFNLVVSQTFMRQSNIGLKEIGEWGSRIIAIIEARLAGQPRVDEQCRWLELKGDFQLNMTFLGQENGVERAMNTFRQILPLLPQAGLYSIGFLVDTLDDYIELLGRVGVKADAVPVIERFLEEARDAADKSNNQHQTAKGQMKKGAVFLEAGGLDNTLQALNYFHRARALWLVAPTMEGHVRALLVIAQVYLGLGMSLAAKYHAFCAIWAAWHSKDETIYPRIAQAEAILFLADFRGGAWIMAMDDYEKFIMGRQDWDPNGWENDKDGMFSTTMPDLAFLVWSGKQFHPEMGVYFDYRTSHWGRLWEKYLSTMVENMQKIMDEDKDLKAVARGHLTDEPLSDLGPERTIAFNALGIQWVIEFENSFIANAIAEEFASMLQIILCEVARLKKGLLRAGVVVRIRVVQSNEYDRIGKHISLDDWLAPVPEFRGKERAEIGKHGAWVALMIKEVLLEYSTIPKDEFNAFWMSLYEQEKMGEKLCGVNPYQKVYYNAVDKKEFDKAQRTAFGSPPSERVFEEPKKFLV